MDNNTDKFSKYTDGDITETSLRIEDEKNKRHFTLMRHNQPAHCPFRPDENLRVQNERKKEIVDFNKSRSCDSRCPMFALRKDATKKEFAVHLSCRGQNSFSTIYIPYSNVVRRSDELKAAEKSKIEVMSGLELEKNQPSVIDIHGK